MVTWNEVFTALMWMAGFNLLLTFVMFIFILKYPKYIVLAYYRYLAFKYNLSKREVKVKQTFSYSYYERGVYSSNTPTLLLVHGFSSSKNSYIALLSHLPKRLHVVVMDLPGHGDTTRKVEDLSITTFVRSVHEFVNAIGLDKKKFHILGASMGGHIAGMYSVEYPNHVTSVTMACPHGIRFKGQQEMIDDALRTQEFSLLPQKMDALKEMFKLLSYSQVKIPEIILSGILQLRLEQNTFYKKLGEALVAPDSIDLLERNLHRLSVPLMLMWGKEDKILSVECVDTILKKLSSPPKQQHLMEEVGHVLFMEKPKKCALMVMEFINSFT